jgi:Domain of unknown function (DUF4329)
MSQQRDLFEAELRKPQPNWEVVIDNLNALAMFEMLPALAPLTAALRTQIAGKARSILETQRGWAGAGDRIDFAVDVVNDRKITSWSSTVPDNQVDDARDFLANLLRPANSNAGRTAFQNTDDAAIAAILEINPSSIAINREFSGTVFRRGGGFGFTPPVRGGATDSNPNVPVPPGTVAVAMYHTHGNGVGHPGGEVFSGDDIFICKSMGRFSYLGTPSGRIKKLTPSALMSPAEQQQNILGVRQQTLR